MYDQKQPPVKSQAATRSCSVKKVFLKISQDSQENLFFNKISETPTQMFSCEFCEMFTNSLFVKATSGGCFYMKNVFVTKFEQISSKVLKPFRES